MQLQNLVSEPKSSEAKGLERFEPGEVCYVDPIGVILADYVCKDLDVPSCPTRPVGWLRRAGSIARRGVIFRPVNDPINEMYSTHHGQAAMSMPL
jgi:hypothetical protein